MLNLKRYQFLHYKDHSQDEYGNFSDIRNCDDGDWVKFEDIKHLLPTKMDEINCLATGAIECIEDRKDYRLAVSKLHEIEKLTDGI